MNTEGVVRNLANCPMSSSLSILISLPQHLSTSDDITPTLLPPSLVTLSLSP